jgi:hypothetical protein
MIDAVLAKIFGTQNERDINRAFRARGEGDQADEIAVPDGPARTVRDLTPFEQT